MITNRIPRIAALVFATLLAAVAVDASVAQAQEQTYTTTCGAGTLNECGRTPDLTCDWVIEVSYGGPGGSFGVKIGKTNCRITGWIPIYKDRNVQSSFSGSCNLLLPFLGMPKGTGCSEDEM